MELLSFTKGYKLSIWIRFFQTYSCKSQVGQGWTSRRWNSTRGWGSTNLVHHRQRRHLRKKSGNWVSSKMLFQAVHNSWDKKFNLSLLTGTSSVLQDHFFTFQENAQHDLQLDSSQFVPVMYKTQIEMSSVISAIPTLLILGFLFW